MLPLSRSVYPSARSAFKFHTSETTLSHYRRRSQFREVQKGGALCLPNYETKHNEIHNAQSVHMRPRRTASHDNAGKTVRIGSLASVKVSPAGFEPATFGFGVG
jgi:hypothetical protein